MGWRKDIKEIVLTGFGSKCAICGYNKCNEALEFHHMDPEKKDFSISSFKVEDMSNIIRELKKCICICANHHREVHNNQFKIPDDVRRYDCRKSKGIMTHCKIIHDKMIERKNKRIKKKKNKRRLNKNVNNDR